MDLTGLHRLCRQDKRGDYVLEREYAAQVLNGLEEWPDLEEILDNMRRWCLSMGINRDGDSFSFQDLHEDLPFSGSATRFRDELSILLKVDSRGRQRYRIPSLWDDYQWSVCYQEPLLAEWRSYPSGEKWWGLSIRDCTDGSKALERFKWLSSRRQIKMVKLLHRGKTVKEYISGRV